MTRNIDDILNELIAIEPSFAAHQGEMRMLIMELMAKKPDTQLDEAFVSSLRARLAGEPVVSPYSNNLSGYSSYIPYAVAVLAVIAAIPFGMQYLRQGSSGAPVFAMNQLIQKVGSDAYGTLTPQESGPGGLGGAATRNAAPMAASAPSDTAASIGTAASPAPVATMAVAPANRVAPAAVSAVATTAAKVAVGYGGGANARMMLPQGPYTVYSYVYKGDPLDLSAAEGDVYARATGQSSGSQIASQLMKFNFGLMNFSAFSDTSVRTFELAENKPYGYIIDVNFPEGTININADYTQWPTLNGKAGDIQPLPVSAMPKDDALISIAKQFLDAHGIDLANYGDPVVQQYSQGLAADSAPGSATEYAPDQITVIYPLKISGTQAYEDGAYPYGLQVGISVRDKKVMSVYGLASQTYTSSSYKLETDPDKILSVLKNGGPHAWVPPTDSGVQIKNVAIEVGTPTRVLMHTYNYVNGKSQELFVPALMFPVTSQSADGSYPKDILVPLVPELLNQAQSGPIPYNVMR